MSANRKVILFIAASLDGFIAKEDGDISFLDSVANPGEDYGYNDFIQQIDTVILGRKTYDKVLSFGIPFPHADKETYIITRQQIPSKEKLHFYNGSMSALVNELKAKEGKHIFVDGGAEIVNLLLKDDLIDEMILSTIPVLLGSGIRLFSADRKELPFKLESIKSFDTGLVQAHYKRTK